MHRTWFLNNSSPVEETRLLGEMIDSTTRTKKIKDEPGTSCNARKRSKTGREKTEEMYPQCISRRCGSSLSP